MISNFVLNFGRFFLSKMPNCIFLPLFWGCLLLIHSLAAYYYGYPAASIALGLFFLFLLSFVFFEKKQVLIVLLCLALTFLALLRYEQKIKQQQLLYSFCNNNPVSLVANVESIERAQHLPFKQMLTFNLKEVTNATNDTSTFTTRLIAYAPKIEDLQVDDVVKIEGIIIKKNNNKDFEKYLIKEQIGAIVFAPNLTCTTIKRPTLSFKRWISSYRDSLSKSLAKKISPQQFQLFESIFLGKNNKQSEDMKEVKNLCLHWGISHYLARSGLHLLLFIFLWNFLLSLVPIHIFYKNSILLIICFLYAAFSYSSISFYRALLMILVSKSCNIFLVRISSMQTFLLVTCFLLIYNPFYLFFLDFQLSFLLTFAIIFYNQSK